MSPIVIQASMFLMSLSLLIVLHEMGHFLPAKAFKTRVEKFYLFFDVKFSLFKKKIGDTVYGIGWLPLGGYVKIAGMIDESMDTEQMSQPPKPWDSGLIYLRGCGYLHSQYQGRLLGDQPGVHGARGTDRRQTHLHRWAAIRKLLRPAPQYDHGGPLYG